MSWKDDISLLEYELVTGDGKSWFPKWLNAVKNVNFNTQGFDFVGVDGTFVSREKKQGSQYDIEIYLDSPSHLDDSELFDRSTRDQRPWTIYHPVFGKIKCQPLSLKYDSSQLSYTKITGTVWETLEYKYPRKSVNSVEIVAQYYEEINNLIIGKKDIESEPEISDSLVSNIDSSSTVSAKTSVTKLSDRYKNMPSTNELATDLKNKVRAASNAADNLLRYPIEFMQQIESLIAFPFQIEQNFLATLRELNKGLDDLLGIGDLSLIEPIASCYLSSTNYFAINGKFDNSKEVVSSIDIILSMNDKVNKFYEDNGISPNFVISQKIDYQKWITIGNLNDIALKSKKQRTIILSKNSNIILLSNKFYGLSDESIEKVLLENNVGIDEVIELEKGREITWYA
jgi:hypothetical protein